jgi:hypothetical protein
LKANDRKKEGHTLARKFDAVHRITTMSSRQMPRVLLAAPASMDPRLFDESSIGVSGSFELPQVSDRELR